MGLRPLSESLTHHPWLRSSSRRWIFHARVPANPLTMGQVWRPLPGTSTSILLTADLVVLGKVSLQHENHLLEPTNTVTVCEQLCHCDRPSHRRRCPLRLGLLERYRGPLGLSAA